MKYAHNCKEELKLADLKATPARLGVLKAIENAAQPMDATDIDNYLKKHNIKADRVTVFRILNLLTAKGLAKPINLNEDKLRFEYANLSEHHHFVCEKCGLIEDISDCNIQALEKNVTKKKGLLIKRHSLEFFGICKNCQS